MRAVICGGGIAGLTAALCLHARGWESVVLEQAPEITEVGAGIQISPNGFKVLAALGLADAIRAAAYEPKVVEMRMGVSGRRLMSIPMKAIAERRWGAPYLQIHRAALIDVLQRALLTRAPSTIRTGVAVRGFQTSETGAVAHSHAEGFEGDIVIGADGAHSTVREQMLGQDAPRFTGNVAWRAVVPRDRLVGHHLPAGACIWAGEGRHAVTYPLGDDLVNFVGIVEHESWRDESWTQAGRREDAIADFEGWSSLIPAIIDQADTHFRWALHDRAPLARWSDKTAVLVGDACHPMLPSLAQGACQAMEDAWVLAACLSDQAGTAAAFRAYEQQRKPRTSRIQTGAAANTRLFHKQGALAKAAAYAPIYAAARLAPHVIHGRNDWIYKHDVTAS